MQLSDLAKLLKAPLQGEDRSFTSVSTDTRELKPGQLFIALSGENFDGHAFLQSAYEKKAAGLVISKPTTFELPTIQVADTRIALGEIAAYHRAKFPDLPIIAITGSCGKTTTKSMIASILAKMGPTLSPIRSFNNDVGVPLTLLELDKKHQYAVIEMGANHPHEIAYLSGITRQNVAVITNVAPAHLEGFGSIEGVARAKGEIYETLSATGVAILNMDDPFCDYWRNVIKTPQIFTFGLTQDADFTAQNIYLDNEARAHFDLVYPEGKIAISLPVLGIHNVMNALAAIAAAYAVGANVEAIQIGLTEVNPTQKRLIKYDGLAGARIIDDTYNANPLSVSAALEILAHSEGERIFVFGGMAELGQEEERFHKEIGDKAKKLGIDKLYACGKLSHFTVQAFGKNGFYFPDQDSLIQALKPLMNKSIVILVKGSRSARMENIVQALML